jgi:hypothetical protein
MPRKLVGTVKVKEPYIMNESNHSEVIFSVHTPFENHSEIIDV